MKTANVPFTTRPELLGRFGMVASTHWIASAAAMAVLEKGGNAFDAAVVGGFTLQVVEPHLNGPGGDAVILLHAAAEGAPRTLCGQGVAPAAASISAFQALDLDFVPGDGLLAAVVPGAVDAWLLLLRDYGTITLEEALAPAIAYAEGGHPLLPHAAETIADRADFFRREWPTSAAQWLPDGKVPRAGSLIANPALARTWRRLIAEAARDGAGRRAEIEAARRIFADGFVADAIERFLALAEVADGTGRRHRGLLAREDMAAWRASYETPVSLDYGDARIFKAGFWSQGPVLLETLAALKNRGLGGLDPAGPEFIHWVVESIKLAMADREAYYGEGIDHRRLLGRLLSDETIAERSASLGAGASLAYRPALISGLEPEAALAVEIAKAAADLTEGSGEPTFGRPAEEVKGRGDTCHISVVDKFGNMVAATPSGGWLQSSPMIPELGLALGSRAQMFRLDARSPSALAPGKRPRTTLSPSLAFRGGDPWLACGTPGGDQQDQWQAIFILRLLEHRLNLQEAIDGPLFHSEHMPLSFWPRGAKPGQMRIEAAAGQDTIAALRDRGHVVAVDPAWSIGRLCAVAREDGLLKGAATPRLMQAYAVGR
jgi:gamma-glutamyltranspeptidase/glutathione hydrolase